jgi:hypothetical protein
MAIQTPPPVTPLATDVPQRGVRSTFSTLVDAFVTWFALTAIPQMAALVQNVYNNAVEAFNSATAANAARVLAETAAAGAVAGPSTTATSTSSATLGFGSKSLTLAQTNKTFALGQWAVFADAADPRNTMSGPITAFTQGTGAITIDARNVTTAAAGVFPTLSNWNVSLTGAGAQTSQSVAESFTPVAVAGTDLDLSLGDYFTKTMAGNSAFTFSNIPTGKSWTLELTITSGIWSLPASVRWQGDLTPTLAAGKTHLLMFVTSNGGTRVRAAVLGPYQT